MYKFICCNLSKSNKSLTNVTRTYKQVVITYENINKHPSSTKRFGSETDLHNIQEDVELPEAVNEIVEEDGLVATTSRSYTSFFSEKMGIKGESSSLLGTDKYSQNTRVIAYSTKSGSNAVNSFYSSKENPQTQRKKYFKNKEAMDMYKSAIQQCMKIKGKKTVDKYSRKINLAPQPIKAASWVDTSKGSNIVKGESFKQEPTKKPVKHFVYVYPEERRRFETSEDSPSSATRRRIITEIDQTLTRKKFRITYPTHLIKYKLSFNKPSTIEQTKSPRKGYSIRGGKVKQAKYPAIRNKQMRDAAKEHSIAYNVAKDTEEAEWQDLVKENPAAEKANRRAKMAINRVYNKLLEAKRLQDRQMIEKQNQLQIMKPLLNVKDGRKEPILQANTLVEQIMNKKRNKLEIRPPPDVKDKRKEAIQPAVAANTLTAHRLKEQMKEKVNKLEMKPPPEVKNQRKEAAPQGVRGSISNWVASFLQDKKQTVDINTDKSKEKAIRMGVPLGSILGKYIEFLEEQRNSNKKIYRSHDLQSLKELQRSKASPSLFWLNYLYLVGLFKLYLDLV